MTNDLGFIELSSIDGPLSDHAVMVLRMVGVQTVLDLTGWTSSDLELAIRKLPRPEEWKGRFGTFDRFPKRTVKEVEDLLEDLGLSLRRPDEHEGP